METPPDPSRADDPEQVLLGAVQLYLARRLRAEAPGALLTLYWEEFFALYAPTVAAIVARHVSRVEDRDDLVQEVWMTVAAKLPDFEWRENRGGLRAWLTTVIRNRTRDLLRRRTRHDVQVASLTEMRSAMERMDPTGDPTAGVEREWEAHRVNTVVEKLRPDIGEVNYRILRMHYWEGRTMPDIAGELELNAGQVASRLHRVLQKLRLCMGAYFGSKE